ncbi:NAD(P)H-hydrate dehydratase [Synechococcus sp. RSCCF101]|nr:NAD(P)H-hydrate dehydratase [Synechococcus sp. RSCCF101]
MGQQRPLPEALQELFARRHRCRPGRVVALDVPSGLCSDRGTPLGDSACRAALTLTIGLCKRGLIQDPALAWVGRLERIDLGLPARLLASLPADTPLALSGEDIGAGPGPHPPAAASKYERGRLMVIAGSERYRGAAALALRGALASGCGSLRACLPRALCESLWLGMPEVVPEIALSGAADGSLQLEPLLPLLDDAGAWAGRLDALLIGPGIGPAPAAGAAASEGIWQALRRWPQLLVLDADGLNRLAARGEAAAWLSGRHGPTWLTPHPAEFGRLFPELRGAEPLEAAATAAGSSGAAILLKGARSVVAAPDGRRWQLRHASGAVARAGLGDVLAGFSAGIGAQMETADAAHLAWAALSHAEAGRHCAAAAGETTASAVAGALARQTRPKH